jgi:hypothetical protein
MLFISGQIAIQKPSGNIITDDIVQETTQVMKNISEILRAAGFNFSNVVKSTIFLTDFTDFRYRASDGVRTLCDIAFGGACPMGEPGSPGQLIARGISTDGSTIVGGTNNSQFGTGNAFRLNDVEGFEEKVILGARSIITKSKPVLIFEQHISNENPSKIIAFLQGHHYEVFMINEVLPKCEYDCRNFIAFSKNKPLPLFPKPLLYKGRSEGIWYASVGEWLIKV